LKTIISSEGGGKVDVCIFGAGIAGSYLAALLRDNGFEYKIFDGRKEPSCHCAWGLSSYRQFSRLASTINLNASRYLLCRIESIITPWGEFKVNDIATFDRKRWLEDLWNIIDVDTGVIFPRDKPDVDADIYVDATGTRRALMGPIYGDRKIQTEQMNAKVTIGKVSPKNIYIYFNDLGGYGWAFPIYPSWHIGAGHINPEKNTELIQGVIKMMGLDPKTDIDVKCRCVASIRWNVDIPRFCQIQRYNGKMLVPIGEAAGLVDIFGAGNIPALKSADILFDCIKRFEVNEYPEKLLGREYFRDMRRKYSLYNNITSKDPIKVLKAATRIYTIVSKRFRKKEIAEFILKNLMKFIKISNEKA